MARLCFLVGSIRFDDNRITLADLHSGLNATLPAGQLPVLAVDGQIIAQSSAIISFAAKIAGIVPSDPIKAAQADEIMFASDEIRDAFVPSYLFEKDEAEKEKKKINLLTNIFPKKLAALEKRVNVTGTPGFAVGSTVSRWSTFTGITATNSHNEVQLVYITAIIQVIFFFFTQVSHADLSIFVNLGWMLGELVPKTGLPGDTLDQYPSLKAIRAKVSSIPAVSEYYTRCPGAFDSTKPAAW